MYFSVPLRSQYAPQILARKDVMCQGMSNRDLCELWMPENV